MGVVRKNKKKSINKQHAIQTLYRDPTQPGSLGGVHRFARAHRKAWKDAKRALEGDLAYTLHKPVRRRFPTLRVRVMGMDHQWVADLVDMQKLASKNKGYKYLLTIVDALSKYAWVQPLKEKTSTNMVQAFREVLKRAFPRHPRRLQTDEGKEFYNAPLQRYFQQNKIHHFSTAGDTKAALVERFNRTLKGRMYRYFTAANTLRYEDVLQELVQGYNATPHRSIKMAPQDVTKSNEAKVWETLYGRTKPKIRTPPFQVGDRVRLSQLRRPFKKGYLPGWTEEVFEVSRVVIGEPITYKIKELDGTPVKGTFYEQELQRVQVGDDTVWRIEKVLKRRGNYLYVQWKGWPSKYNSWIRKEDIV